MGASDGGLDLNAAADTWAAQFGLAEALMVEGRSRQATTPLLRAVELNPNLAPGWRLLGDLRLFRGDLPGAQQAYDLWARAMMRDPVLQAAADALLAGRPDEVAQRLAPALAQPTAPAAALLLLGEALMRLSRWDEAETALRTALARAAGFDPARESLAGILLQQGRNGEALAELDQVLAREPKSTRCRILKAAVLTEASDYAAAARVTRALLDDFPDEPKGWLLYGAGLRTLGRTAEAVEAFGEALRLDPDCTEAWWSLSNLKTFRFSDVQRAEMERRLAAPGLDADGRSNLLFALGKAHEDDGRWAEAFAKFVEGNRLQKSRRAYDPARTHDFVQSSRKIFTRAFFETRRRWGETSGAPIFIVGLPRSGSTLIEQILASHPQVEGLRELQEIRTMAAWISGPEQPSGRSVYPGVVTQMPREAARQFGQDYLALTRAYRRTDRPRFIDKAPWNFEHLGLIGMILPNAKVIDARRHPLACCVSAFKQHFSEGWDFAFDLGDLGRYYADYVALMAHFDQVQPGRVHRVIYERMVDDLEGEVRRLLAYLGLPFDEACLRFFENPRAVATPSSEQVRRPVFRDAVEQWRNYEPWLDPLKAALGPVLEGWEG